MSRYKVSLCQQFFSFFFHVYCFINIDNIHINIRHKCKAMRLNRRQTPEKAYAYVCGRRKTRAYCSAPRRRGVIWSHCLLQLLGGGRPQTGNSLVPERVSHPLLVFILWSSSCVYFIYFAGQVKSGSHPVGPSGHGCCSDVLPPLSVSNQLLESN